MAHTTLTVVGNLTRDPEVKYTQNGHAHARFAVAVNRSWRHPQTGEWESEADFVPVVCWRTLAENVADTLTKGNRVVATGRLESRTWTDNDGNDRTITELVADDIGASLKNATATVERNEPANGGGSW